MNQSVLAPASPASGLGHGDDRPSLLITIDTEGDNLWARPETVTTENSLFLPRFQQLCESWGFKPTYLVDYDMARSEPFVEFGKDALRRKEAEIGMHNHAWNTPPLGQLTDDDNTHHPYLIEYPESTLRDKVGFMTELLGETFGVAVRSHRAGRWAFNAVYAKALIANGYWVDCSVTPHVSWEAYKGDPNGSGGSDYRRFPQRPYFLDADDVSRPGHSDLLEIPMTIMPCRFRLVNRIRERCTERSMLRRGLDRLFPPVTWFRAKTDNLDRMLAVLSWATSQKHDYVEFMLHSSELMPGGSPSFPGDAEIEKLYENLDVLFAAAATGFRGATLSEYYKELCASGGR
jgi:hypothetical protein